MAAISISGDVTHQRRDGDGDVEDPLGDGAPSTALDLLDVDEGPPTEVLGPKAGDVDVAEPGGEGDVVAGIRQLTGELVDDVRRDGRQRDHHAGGTGPFEHRLGRLDPAEHVDAADADLVGADETHDPVPEVGRALRGVEQTDGVGVGADDEDRPADLALPAHAHEDPPGHHPLDGEQQRDEHQYGARSTGGTAP